MHNYSRWVSREAPPPPFQWSHDDSYIARMGKDLISIYEVPAMKLLDHMSLSASGILEFQWSPRANILESGKGEFFTFLEGDLEKRVKLVLSGLGSPQEIQTSAKEASPISFKENLKAKDVQNSEKEASPSHLKCENIQEDSTENTFEKISTKTDFPEEQEFQNEHYVSPSSQSQSNCEREEEEVQDDLSPNGNSTEEPQDKVHRAQNGHAFDAGFPADPEPDDFFHSNPTEKPNSTEEPSTEAPKPASPQFNEFSFRSRSFEDSLLKSMSMTSSTNDLSEEEDTTPQFILKKRKKNKNFPPVPSSPSHAVQHDEYRQDLSEKNDLSGLGGYKVLYQIKFA